MTTVATQEKEYTLRVLFNGQEENVPLAQPSDSHTALIGLFGPGMAQAMRPIADLACEEFRNSKIVVVELNYATDHINVRAL